MFLSIWKDRLKIFWPTVRFKEVLGDLQITTQNHNRDFQTREGPNSMSKPVWLLKNSSLSQELLLSNCSLGSGASITQDKTINVF